MIEIPKREIKIPAYFLSIIFLSLFYGMKTKTSTDSRITQRIRIGAGQGREGLDMPSIMLLE